jgi:hypothetical protein
MKKCLQYGVPTVVCNWLEPLFSAQTAVKGCYTGQFQPLQPIPILSGIIHRQMIVKDGD